MVLLSHLHPSVTGSPKRKFNDSSAGVRDWVEYAYVHISLNQQSVKSYFSIGTVQDLSL